MLCRVRKILYRLRIKYVDDRRGSTSIEFAAVMPIFLSLLFGQLAVGLYFFSTFSLEYGVKEAARQIRTGQAQIAGNTTGDIKNEICAKALAVIDCANNLQINIIQSPSATAITAPSCLDSSGQMMQGLSGGNAIPGAPQNTIFLLACYEWELAGAIPYLKLGQMNNGSALIQAATIFQTEPYSLNSNTGQTN